MQSYPANGYQIGIICALPKELKAVKAIFDEEHEPLGSQDAQDHNTYVLGRIGKHHVVAAGLPAGVYGTTSAASVAKDMSRTFSQLRFGLLVGIGGGIPSIKERIDIRLGDVVVSQPSAEFGGVVQYDLGKLVNGKFERKGVLNKPPQRLLTALTNLRASIESPMAEYLEVIDRKYPSLKEEGYCYQGAHQDCLYCSRCHSSQWWWLLWALIVWLWPLWRCEECDNGKVRRGQRPHARPRIHYGIIASGNTLLKDGFKRDQLKRDLGARCIEMEAAGLDDYPCLVIRGICDYADVHKNDAWQEYAALTAAIFAKELLQYISLSAAQDERPVQELISSLDKHFRRQDEHNIRQQEHNQWQETYYHDDRHRRCHQMFKTGEYESQKNINPHAVEGTCQWVLNHPHFKTWSASVRDDLLWISADPGCGKSVLARSMIDTFFHHEDRDGTFSICYFFFKDIEQQNSLATALCAIIHQLFSQQPGLIAHALPAFDKNGEKLQRDVHELWRILQSAVDDVTRPTYFVLDALDECRDGDRAHLIGLLTDLYSNWQNRTSKGVLSKWLITSRPYDDICDRFDKIPSTLPSIRLRGEAESDQIQSEINLVIQVRMKELSRVLRLSAGEAKTIETELSRMEHRTYLWLHLAIDAIKKNFRKAIRRADRVIPLVPTSIEQAYENILARIDSEDKGNALKVLTIIVGARRPLTIGEMALALDIATLDKAPTSLTDLTAKAEQLGNNIRQWCGLFVLITSGRLYLLHQTAKEFLLTRHSSDPTRDCWKHILHFLDVEKEMARISSDKEDCDAVADETSCIRTFFDFAAQHWSSYVLSTEFHSDNDNSLSSAIDSLYGTSSRRYWVWTAAMWKTSEYCHTRFNTGIIHLAAFNGHVSVLQRALSRASVPLDEIDEHNRTPLLWAVERGHTNVIQLLLDRGAEVNARDGYFGTALQEASRRGYLEIVQLLLDRGADVNARDSNFGTALQAASDGGYLEVVQALLDRGADVNAQDGHYSTALQAASNGGYLEVVQLLLDRGADIDAQSGIYGSALHAASAMGHTELEELLIQYRATQ